MVSALVAVSSAVLSLISVGHALGMLLMLFIFHGYLVAQFGENAGRIPFFFALGIAVIAPLKLRSIQIPVGAWVTAALGILVTLSAVAGSDSEESALTLIQYLKSFAMGILVSILIQSDKDRRLVFFYWSAAVAMASVLTVYLYWSGQAAIQTGYLERVASIRGDPNETAMYLLPGLAFALYLGAATDDWRRLILSMALFVVTMGAIVTTYSRGGMIAAALTVAVFFLQRPSLRIAVAVVAGGLLLLPFVPQSYLDRIDSLFTGKAQYNKSMADSSLASRAQLLAKGIYLIAENPILGVGPGRFGETDSPSLPPDVNSQLKGAVAHNSYLELGAEAGLLSAGTFLWLAYRSIWQPWRGSTARDRSHRASLSYDYFVGLGILSMLVAALFLSMSKNGALWFLMGYAWTFSSKASFSDTGAVRGPSHIAAISKRRQT